MDTIQLSDVFTNNNWSVMHLCAWFGCDQHLHALIKKGFDVNQIDFVSFYTAWGLTLTSSSFSRRENLL